MSALSETSPSTIPASSSATFPATPPVEPAHVAVHRQKVGVRRVVIVGSIGAIAVDVFFLHLVMTSSEQTTDDAIVDADVVGVSVRVSGLVTHLRVQENTLVKKGDTIAELDTVELAARVQQAEGELAAATAQAETAAAQQKVTEAGARGGLSSARAQVLTAKAQLASSAAQIDAVHAQYTHAQAAATKAQNDFARMQKLREGGAATQEALDNSAAALEAANAQLMGATANLAVANESRSVAASRVQEAGGALDANAPLDAKIAAAKGNAEIARARVTSAQAALDLARMMLSYTTIVAPNDGMVSRVSLREGQLVSNGQSVASLVPTATYIVANYKETQIGAMKPGQKVDIEVDALPGKKLQGEVESLAAATGSRFSLLPPDNAAGNFVKVVQRVPVRIKWTNAGDVPLRAGMSATTTVHTD